jgi:ribosomal protein L40E
VRCPECGARNSEDATWCTQCYADVRGADHGATGAASPVPPAPGGSPAAGQPALPVPPADGVPADRPGEPAGADGRHRDVRDRDGRIEWRCAACEGWNPLEAASCLVCGSERRGFGEPTPREPDLGDVGIVGASLLLPGLGHVLAGRSGTGFARAILAVLWLFGGLVLVVGSGGIAGLPGWWLLASAGVVWVATVADAQRLVAGDRPQLLTTRRLGALVLVVTVGLVLAVVVVLAVDR